ncbi:MAG TPA: aminotransferase class V-fold PLP-dependent enzyme [Anaerolineales bacterium]
MPALKNQFLLNPKIHFLNHGSFGATPKPVFENYQRWQRQLEHQPVEFLGRRATELMADSRLALGKYLGTRADNLVYTQNVTIALNIVARSLELGSGDEVLSSDHEYGALDRTWRFLSKERGFKYIHQKISLPLSTTQQFVDDLWQGVTPQTRVIFLSHITSPTAILFPVAEVIRRAREQNILTIIDGAHAPGQIHLELDYLGADFYGGNLHKWLCAPKGAGFLYARPEVQPLLKPLVVSWGYESEAPSGSTLVDYHEWMGTRDLSAFLSVPAAIEFQKKHDWDRVRADCHGLAREALNQIEKLTEIPSYYPDDSWYAQMFAAQLPDSVDVLKFKARLYDKYRIEAPVHEWNGKKLIRISIQGYNTQEDIKALINALKRMLSKRV